MLTHWTCNHWKPRYLVALFCLLGCGKAGPTTSESTIDVATLQQHRDRWVLTEEPVGAITLSELRQMFADLPIEEAKTQNLEATIVGTVGALDAGDKDTDENPLWVKGSAEFRLLDQALPTEDTPSTGEAPHDHDPNSGDHSECEFCKKMKAAQAPVIVRLLDESSAPLPVDARTLFGLHGNEELVVQGRAQLQAGSIFLNAEKIFIRTSHTFHTTAAP